MTSDAPTNAEKHVPSNNASAGSHAVIHTIFSLLIGLKDVVRYNVVISRLLLEHQTSFQAYCQYINAPLTKVCHGTHNCLKSHKYFYLQTN